MSTAGHPDWTPALRGYAAGLVQPHTTTAVPAAGQVIIDLPALTLYDVNVLEVLLPVACSARLIPFDQLGQFVSTVELINTDVDPHALHLPARNQGADLHVVLFNRGGVGQNVDWLVQGYNGIPPDDLRLPPCMGAAPTLAPPVGVLSTTLVLPFLAAFDRLAWAGEGDRSFDMVARLFIPTGTTFTTSDLLLGSSVAGEAIAGEFAPMAAGVLIGAVNQTTGGLVGQVTVRAWYDS